MEARAQFKKLWLSSKQLARSISTASRKKYSQAQLRNISKSGFKARTGPAVASRAKFFLQVAEINQNMNSLLFAKILLETNT